MGRIQRPVRVMLIGVAAISASLLLPRIASSAVTVNSADDLEMNATFLQVGDGPAKRVDDPTAQPPLPPTATKERPAPRPTLPAISDADSAVVQQLLQSELPSALISITPLPLTGSDATFRTRDGHKAAYGDYPIEGKAYSGKVTFLYEASSTDLTAVAISGRVTDLSNVHAVVDLEDAKILLLDPISYKDFVPDDPALLERVLKQQANRAVRD